MTTAKNANARRQPPGEGASKNADDGQIIAKDARCNQGAFSCRGREPHLRWHCGGVPRMIKRLLKIMTVRLASAGVMPAALAAWILNRGGMRHV